MRFVRNTGERSCDESAPEPAMEKVIASVKKTLRKPKKKGQREEDLKGFPQEEILHDISEKDLNEAFGERTA